MPMLLPLISLQSCRIAVLSDYESKRIESESVPAHTLVHYNISRDDEVILFQLIDSHLTVISPDGK